MEDHKALRVYLQGWLGQKERNMMGKVRSLTIIGSVILIVYLIPLIAIAESPSPEAKGKLLFKQNCEVCHGLDGRGENPLKPMGGMKDDGVYLAPAINGTGHTWHHPDGMIFDIIKNGSFAKESPMRGFKEKFADEDINLIMNYFKTMWPEKIRTMHAKRENNIKAQKQN